MKFNNVIMAFVAVVIFASGSNAFACGGSVGWANPANNTKQLSLADAISSAKMELGLEVKKSELQSRCGSDLDFSVVDIATGKSVGSIPVPRQAEQANDGRYLQVRLEQMMQTPRQQLIAITGASRIFYDDVEGLNEDLGIGAYVPNALPIEQRTENNGQNYLVYVNIDAYCSGQYQESPSLVFRGMAIKTLEYIPSRTDYSASAIYQKGDLKKTILGNTEIMTEIKKRIASNAQFCRDDVYGQKQKWIEVSGRLNGSMEQLLQNSVQKFQLEKQKPSSAYMRHENRIVVEFGQSKKSFAGAVSEMVAIQKLLTGQGVATDKRSRLDYRGKISIDFAKEYNRPLPESLQE